MRILLLLVVLIWKETNAEQQIQVAAAVDVPNESESQDFPLPGSILPVQFGVAAHPSDSIIHLSGSETDGRQTLFTLSGDQGSRGGSRRHKRSLRYEDDISYLQRRASQSKALADIIRRVIPPSDTSFESDSQKRRRGQRHGDSNGRTSAQRRHRNSPRKHRRSEAEVRKLLTEYTALQKELNRLERSLANTKSFDTEKDESEYEDDDYENERNVELPAGEDFESELDDKIKSATKTLEHSKTESPATLPPSTTTTTTTATTTTTSPTTTTSTTTTTTTTTTTSASTTASSTSPPTTSAEETTAEATTANSYVSSSTEYAPEAAEVDKVDAPKKIVQWTYDPYKTPTMVGFPDVPVPTTTTQKPTTSSIIENIQEEYDEEEEENQSPPESEALPTHPDFVPVVMGPKGPIVLPHYVVDEQGKRGPVITGVTPLPRRPTIPIAPPTAPNMFKNIKTDRIVTKEDRDNGVAEGEEYDEDIDVEEEDEDSQQQKSSTKSLRIGPGQVAEYVTINGEAPIFTGLTRQPFGRPRPTVTSLKFNGNREFLRRNQFYDASATVDPRFGIGRQTPVYASFGPSQDFLSRRALGARQRALSNFQMKENIDYPYFDQ